MQRIAFKGTVSHEDLRKWGHVLLAVYVMKQDECGWIAAARFKIPAPKADVLLLRSELSALLAGGSDDCSGPCFWLVTLASC